jgi:hypothetical protein
MSKFFCSKGYYFSHINQKERNRLLNLIFKGFVIFKIQIFLDYEKNLISYYTQVKVVKVVEYILSFLDNTIHI